MCHPLVNKTIREKIGFFHVVILSACHLCHWGRFHQNQSKSSAPTATAAAGRPRYAWWERLSSGLWPAAPPLPARRQHRQHTAGDPGHPAGPPGGEGNGGGTRTRAEPPGGPCCSEIRGAQKHYTAPKSTQNESYL